MTSPPIGKGALVFVVLASAGIVAASISSNVSPRAPAANLSDFGPVLATLLFTSAILERALDVVLSLMYGGAADDLDREIRRLKAIDQTQIQQSEKDSLAALLIQRSAHSQRTRQWALPIAVVAGLTVSAVGLRSLEPLFQKAASEQNWFTGVDIIVTGLLLAGGSDGIHWLVALYRDWIDKNRSTKS